jgi:hypothetical protein
MEDLKRLSRFFLKKTMHGLKRQGTGHVIKIKSCMRLRTCKSCNFTTNEFFQMLNRLVNVLYNIWEKRLLRIIIKIPVKIVLLARTRQ